MKKLIIFIYIIIITLTSGNAGEQSVAQENKKVLIAVSEFPPYVDNRKEDNGFLLQIIDAAFNEVGIKPDYKFYPWKRSERYLKNGKAFAVFPYVSTEWSKQSEEKYLVSDGIMDCRIKLFYYKKSKTYFKFENLDDLKNYKIGSVSGYLYFYNDIFEKIGVMDIFYSDEEASALKQLVSGKVDLVPYMQLHGWQLIKDAYSEKEKEFTTLSRTKTTIVKEKNFNVLDRSLSESPLRLLVTRNFPDSEELVKKFNRAMIRIKNNGTYDLIIKNHNMLKY